jgi:hypothetical protein
MDSRLAGFVILFVKDLMQFEDRVPVFVVVSLPAFTAAPLLSYLKLNLEQARRILATRACWATLSS